MLLSSVDNWTSGYLTTLFQLQKLHSIVRGGNMITSGEYVRIWKEAIVEHFEVTWHSSGKTNDPTIKKKKKANQTRFETNTEAHSVITTPTYSVW